MMLTTGLRAAAAAAGFLIASCAGERSGLDIPVTYRTLDNGLRVVISQDRSVPTATIAVRYDVGYRTEPKGQSGFAHLVEHLMFEGSQNLRNKGEFISLVSANGGAFEAVTRHDFTAFHNAVPSHMTETLLWAEADRMRGPALNEQNLAALKEAIRREVEGTLRSRAYGGFPWLDLTKLAYTNWFNAHDFYGDLSDIEAATVEDLAAYFHSNFVPNNAVVIVAGDVNPSETLAWVEKYFGDIPRADPIERPDVSEPPQQAEKQQAKVDPYAQLPAVGWGYHMPPRRTPEWAAMIIIDSILLKGRDSRLDRALVQELGYGESVGGGVNWPLGNLYDYDGPMLWSGAIAHGAERSSAEVIEAFNGVIRKLQSELVSAEELERARLKVRSALYELTDGENRVALVGLLASFALFDDDPARVNRLEAEFAAVTPELVQSVAQKYLVPSNRSIVTLAPRFTLERSQ